MVLRGPPRGRVERCRTNFDKGVARKSGPFVLSQGEVMNERPESDRPRRDDRRSDRPRSDRSGSDRPRSNRSGSDRPRRDGDKPRSAGPRSAGPRSAGPRSAGPRSAGPRSDRPSSDRPRRDGDKPRSFGPRNSDSRNSGSRNSGPGNDRPRSVRPRFDKPREEFVPRAPRGPAIDDDVTGEELDKGIKHELKSLGEGGAKAVSRRLVMIARLIDTEPELAWEHAKAALQSAGRLAIVREAAGLAAYHAGLYAEALRELRAHRRMSGSDEHWPVMADCERGLGRPEKALQMAGADEVKNLTRAQAVEMRIVAAGARADLGQLDAAVVTLQCRELSMNSKDSWVLRLRYAYADALLAVGRTEEARTWFVKAADADPEALTDALDRVAELDGVVLESLDDHEEEDD